MAACPAMAADEFPIPEDVRGVPADSYRTPYYDKDNPFVTHYAPWLRNLHLMRADEAIANANAGIVGGESNQQVRMLEISPFDSNIMYFITNTSGIYTTKDGGKFWYNTTNNMRGHDARGLWCDVKDKNTVYASVERDGFYRSKNGGSSWELIIKDTDSKSVHRSNTITQDSQGNTYFATSTGIYRLDYGANTTEGLHCLYAISENPLWSDIDVSPDGKHVYAAMRRNGDSNITPGLYISHDYGKTWSIKATNTSYEYNVYSIALYPDNPEKIYFTAIKKAAGTYADGDLIDTNSGETSSDVVNMNNCALYVSEDGGNSFKAICVYSVDGKDSDGKKVTYYKNFYGLRFGPKNGEGFYPLYFSANATNNPLRVSESAAYKSFKAVYTYRDDLGEGTIREPAGATYYNEGWLYQAFAPDMKTPGRIVFAESGIYEKTGDKKAIRISGGFSGASVTDITFDSTGKPFFITTDVGTHIADGVYEQKEDGTYTYPTFKEGVGGHFTMAEFNPKDYDHIVAYTGANNGSDDDYPYAIRQSFDGGKTFNSKESTARLSKSDTSVITNNTVIRFDGDKIYTSYFTGTITETNGEKSVAWERNTVDGTNPIFILTASKTNPKLMVGITKESSESCLLYKSADGGKTWTKLSKPLTIVPGDIECAEFDVYGENGEDDGDWVWILSKRHVYHCDIENGVYENINSRLTPNAFASMAQNPDNPNHILLGTRPNFVSWGKDNKLSESYDGGKTWHTVGGLWGQEINEIKFVPNTTEVFIGTFAGVFIYDYAKFNYYCSVPLIICEKTEWITLPRFNDDNKNVNNGKYIIAPPYTYTVPKGKKFIGWVYKDKLYETGVKIPIED